MSDRIAGVVLTALALGYVLLAGNYEAGFGDPLGPSMLPRIVGVPAMLLAATLIVWPGHGAEWAKGRRLLLQFAAVATLIAYALLLERVGFLAATVALLCVMALYMGARPGPALALGVVGSPLLYALFDKALDLPLPLLGTFFA